MRASTRFLSRFGAFGFFVVVGANTPTDTTRQVYGYGGIVIVPAAVDGATAQTPDILNQRRIAVRTKNGRVLYANERVTMPAGPDETRTVARSGVHHPCSQLVQSRAAAGPNS
jgi:hypothetical protein